MMIGGMVAHAYNWRVAMMVVGLPGVILAVVVWLFMVEPRRGLSDAQRAMEAPAAMPTLGEGVVAMWRNRAALYLVAAVTLTSLVGYALTGWGPSYMQRSLGLSMLDVSKYVALPAAIIGSTSALLGGIAADRAAKRHGLHAQSWVVALFKLIAFPFAVGFYFVDDPRLALASYFIAALFAGAYLGPSFALIQHLAPIKLRSVWAALTLLVINLVGLGLGPFLVGRLSDSLRPTYGAESLRWAMLCVALLTPLAILAYWRAGAVMKQCSDTK